MQDITAREYVLKRIRQALIRKKGQRFPAVDWDKNIYAASGESREEQFAKSFTRVGGQFVFCENENEFLELLVKLAGENDWKHVYCREASIQKMVSGAGIACTEDDTNFPEGMVSITSCEALVARLGSILVSSRQGAGRKAFVIPTIHIVVAYAAQLVPEMKDGLQMIKNKYGDKMPSFIASLTGPSRTADIEKTLVTPAHGPRDIFVFLIDS
jgi:L-lactate dehydrogenase complex protein LldG